MIQATPGDYEYSGETWIAIFQLALFPSLIVGLVFGFVIRRNVYAVVAISAFIFAAASIVTFSIGPRPDSFSYLVGMSLVFPPSLLPALLGLVLVRVYQWLRRSMDVQISRQG